MDDLDGEKDRVEGYRSLLSGAAAEVRKFDTAEEEGQFLIETVKELLKHKQPEEICLVTRTGKLLTDHFQLLLKAQGAVRRVGEEERPGRAGSASGDHAPGQGAGVPRDASGRATKASCPYGCRPWKAIPPPGLNMRSESDPCSSWRQPGRGIT